MTAAVEVLHALARALSGLGLYADGHPIRARALETLYEKIAVLQEEMPSPVYSFIEDEVVLGVHPLRELSDWPWAARLAAVGVQRVEFAEPVDRDDLAHFLADLGVRLSTGGASSSEARVTRLTGIRYGLLGLKGDDDVVARLEAAGADGEREIDLAPEAAALVWLHDELRGGGTLHLAEAEAVVASLLYAMQADQAMLMPLVRLKDHDQYTTTHALNVSVLAMALAEHLGLSGARVRGFGISGLLHDVGKVKIPVEVLTKPGKLSDVERALMNSHTVEGARLILSHDADLDLAAVVAYEHHKRIDGGGYPAFRTPRACHDASDLVHVCDVYDALRTHRPYRDAWEHERVMAYIHEGAGREFRAEMAGAFTAMMRRWTPGVGRIGSADATPD